MTRMPARLEDARDQIDDYAKQYGLDYYPTVFECVTPREMIVVAARDGFPSRYEHWRFGMEYRRMKTHFDMGQMRIYELVLNNDPSLAYLLNDNDDVNNKLVIAHVFAHVDFFKNNMHFGPTNRQMINQMANHRRRVKNYSNAVGIDLVDDFIDNVLSINNLIDFQAMEPLSTLNPQKKNTKRFEGAPGDEDLDSKLRDTEYMDWWLKEMYPEQHTPVIEPQKKGIRDVMLFLIENAPLRDWEVDTLSMLRDETYYFAPQRRTKIMNEGWATYWHTKIMRGEGLYLSGPERHGLDIPLLPPILDFSEMDLYARTNAGVLATSKTQLNPYKLGVEMYRHIEDRWNKGKVGSDYEECTDMETKLAWDSQLNEGRDFIFMVRELYTDFGFLNRFLTKEFCREQNLFIYDYNPYSGWYEISDRDWLKIKSRLLNQFTNAGEPIIEIIDDNYKNRGELYLEHEHLGLPEFDLKLDHAIDTLRSLHYLWRRPVHLETIFDNKRMRFSFDGGKPWAEEIEDLNPTTNTLPPWAI